MPGAIHNIYLVALGRLDVISAAAGRRQRRVFVIRSLHASTNKSRLNRCGVSPRHPGAAIFCRCRVQSLLCLEPGGHGPSGGLTAVVKHVAVSIGGDREAGVPEQPRNVFERHTSSKPL